MSKKHPEDVRCDLITFDLVRSELRDKTESLLRKALQKGHPVGVKECEEFGENGDSMKQCFLDGLLGIARVGCRLKDKVKSRHLLVGAVKIDEGERPKSGDVVVTFAIKKENKIKAITFYGVVLSLLFKGQKYMAVVPIEWDFEGFDNSRFTHLYSVPPKGSKLPTSCVPKHVVGDIVHAEKEDLMEVVEIDRRMPEDAFSKRQEIKFKQKGENKSISLALDDGEDVKFAREMTEKIVETSKNEVMIVQTESNKNERRSEKQD